MGTEPTTVCPAGFTLHINDALSRDIFCFSLFLIKLAFFNTEERFVLQNSSQAAFAFLKAGLLLLRFSSPSFSSHEPL